MANESQPTNRQTQSAFGVMFAIILLAIGFYNIGDHEDTTKFFHSANAVVVSSTKTTTHPSRTPEARTEPLTASATIVQTPSTTLEPAPTPVIPQDNESIVWARLISEGFSREQTAGIMGNLKQEHHFRTDGDGLAQWIGNRKANLLQRSNPYDLTVQLDYLMEELNGSYAYVRDGIKSAGLVDSVLIFQNQFERCGVCMQDNRIRYAYEILGSH